MDHDEHPEDGLALGGSVPADRSTAVDPLLELRAALDTVGELPLAERARIFDRTHAVVVEELRALELG